MSIDFAGTLSHPRLRCRPGDGVHAAQVIQHLHGVAMPPGWADAYTSRFARRWATATADALPGLLRQLANQFGMPVPAADHLIAAEPAQELAVDLVAASGDHPIPDAHADTIRSLKRAGFTLVLACNTSRPAAMRIATLAAARIERCFAAVVASSTVGAAKPDPAFFRLVAEAAGVPIEKVMHVGDSLHYDVAGAQAAGAGAVWIRANPTAARPDHPVDLSTVRQAATFPDLLRLVDLTGNRDGA